MPKFTVMIRDTAICEVEAVVVVEAETFEDAVEKLRNRPDAEEWEGEELDWEQNSEWWERTHDTTYHEISD